MINKMKIVLIISFFLFSHCVNAQIARITIYHTSFFDSFPYVGGPYETQIKTTSNVRVYKSNDKTLFKSLRKYIRKLNKMSDYIPLTGADNVQFLIEIKRLDGRIQRIYAWGNGEMFYKKKLLKRDEYFIQLIEKYFPNDISWSDWNIDHKN